MFSIVLLFGNVTSIVFIAGIMLWHGAPRSFKKWLEAPVSIVILVVFPFDVRKDNEGGEGMIQWSLTVSL